MKKRVSLAAFGIAGALLVGSLSIGQAWSYFTDSSRATGGIPIKVAPHTDITEEFSGGVKTIHIVNDEDSVPVYVRARVFANAEYLSSVAGEGWSGPAADGWYYFGEVVQPGDEAAPLQVTVNFPEFKKTTTENPDGTTTVVEEEIDHNGENFNVIVVYEATPGIYGEDGELCAPADANWALAS